MQLTQARKIAMLVAGLATPIGILVVNVSAFVMRNLVEFRFGIAICALVSSLLLNGLTALWVLAQLERNTTHLYLEYRRWMVALAAVVVLATSGLAPILTFQGMRDPHHLPDALSVWWAIGALALPVVAAVVVRRLSTRGRGSRRNPEHPARRPLTRRGDQSSA